MTTATRNQMTYTQLFAKVEKELGKKVTDMATWNLVEKFWAYEGDCQPGLFDRVALLESRMFNQHGWSRH